MKKTTANLLASYLYKDETACIEELLSSLLWPEALAGRVHDDALELVRTVRSAKRKPGELESFLQQYALNTDEGLALMCLAEALLRIPDSVTRDALIRDKVEAAEWLKAAGGSKDWLVKASGVGLMLSRKTLESAVGRLGEPVIREAMIAAMRLMGRNFVLGRTIEEAFKHAEPLEKQGYRMSYDMLGEGARTRDDAQRYFESYASAIRYIGAHASTDFDCRAGVSVKLSALHPRYEYAQSETCLPEIIASLKELATIARDENVAMTIDAEESERLEISLQVIKAVLEDTQFADFDGFGMAVQAYQKRALPLIKHIGETLEGLSRRMQMRLVKGAYWDREIKNAQVMGLPSYPVFTRKISTDLSYLTCAQEMLERSDNIYPMLATHNAHSVAAVLKMAEERAASFEFQRLHGMGEVLYDHVLEKYDVSVSVYAPVGPHSDLLAYLVRRLLENGANSSFVNRLLDENVPLESLVDDPVAVVSTLTEKPHPKIPLPAHIYGARLNSKGIDLDDETQVVPLLKSIRKFEDSIKGRKTPDAAGEKEIEHAFKTAHTAFEKWSESSAETRAKVLEKYADLIEENMAELMALCVYEAGKTLPDAVAEIREAVDFCRYYAVRGREDFSAQGMKFTGPTGEDNHMVMEPRGTFVCISPWNFPLAIFTGQVSAALMAGNCVIAKPAEQTPMIAAKAVELMHKAGIPEGVLQIVQGDGKTGAALVAHEDVAGVAFTGSVAAAKSIQRALASKDGAIVPLIAETGGQNAMIVDSSALPEQVVDSVIMSAFGSAGQRCSALRVLYLQEDTADKIIEMLKGAMAELKVGAPSGLSTDIGSVIDKEALAALEEHCAEMEKTATLIAKAPLDKALKQQGYFIAPCAFEIHSMAELSKEHFGSILHVIRYKASEIDKVIREINASGYGLTFGIHSRIDDFIDNVLAQIKVGNAYVNRSTIGAVVGVQPFGGRGLSGTGPKAGGPHYLHTFATEKVVSVDTTAAGGNASLVTLEE